MSELPAQVNAWLVIFIGIWLQALPFLLLGTIISSALTAFLKPRTLARFLPRRTAMAVPVAGLAGIALPACECASVPTTRSLVRAGVPTADRFAESTTGQQGQLWRKPPAESMAMPRNVAHCRR